MTLILNNGKLILSSINTSYILGNGTFFGRVTLHNCLAHHTSIRQYWSKWECIRQNRSFGDVYVVKQYLFLLAKLGIFYFQFFWCVYTCFHVGWPTSCSWRKGEWSPPKLLLVKKKRVLVALWAPLAFSLRWRRVVASVKAVVCNPAGI